MEAMGEQAAEKLLWQTSTSLTYTFGGTGEDHAGCSKRPTSTAAGESNPEAYPRGRTVRRIRSTTSVRAAESVRRPGPR